MRADPHRGRGTQVNLTAVRGIPLIEPGDNLPAMLIDALRDNGIALRDHDVIVVAQKIVSKAEGRYVTLGDVVPSARAHELSQAVGKDPRLVEVILSQSDEVVRYRTGVLVVAHRLGFVMANAGVDQSNVDHRGGERVLLLPAAPDASCAALKGRLDDAFDADVAVVINDSFGRAWRNGVVGVALGCAGMPALASHVGESDLFGRPLRVTEVALADEVAAAASMLMGQTDAGLPVVHIRGLSWAAAPRPAAALVRPKAMDMFR